MKLLRENDDLLQGEVKSMHTQNKHRRACDNSTHLIPPPKRQHFAIRAPFPFTSHNRNMRGKVHIIQKKKKNRFAEVSE